MKKFDLEKQMQTARQIKALLEPQFDDLTFAIVESEEDKYVELCADRPGDGVVASITMDEFPKRASLEEKAEIFKGIIEELLSDDDEEEDEKDADDGDSAIEDRVLNIVEQYRNCSRDYMLRHVLLEAVDERQNAEMLQRCTHVKQLDLAGLFVFPVRVDHHTTGAMQLSWDQVKALGITADELYAAARKNMVRYLRVRVCPLLRLGHQVTRHGIWYGRGLENADMDEDGWYAIGSHRKILSSGFLFVPEVLDALGEKLESNYYITAPNVHEMMICRESGDRSILQAYVDWLKQTRQDDKFALPDHLYFYDRAKGLQSVNRL